MPASFTSWFGRAESHRVFISYRRVEPDASYALRLHDSLRRAGLDVFIDRNIPAGVRWASELSQALKRAKTFVVLLSRASIESDMIRQEVKEAHGLSQKEGLRILPVRLDFSGALPFDLAAYLDPITYLLWTTSQSWDATCEDIAAYIRHDRGTTIDGGTVASPLSTVDLTELVSIPLPAADPRLETGAVELDSPFYVERRADIELKALIAEGAKTVLIKGPRQVGKTSLLCRAKAEAERRGHRVVYVDLQLVDQQYLASWQSLLMYLGQRIAATLRTDVRPDQLWNNFLSGPDNLIAFLNRSVLSDGAPFVLCLDELDRIFDQEYRTSFFAMLRAWHNLRAQDAKWRLFGLLLAHSTEPALFIEDLNQSPFNVGTVFRLGDFTREEIEILNQRHGRPLKTSTEIEDLFGLIGGHPYLVRQALYLLTTRRVETLGQLLALSSDDDGPFADHLRHHLFGLTKRPHLASAYKNVLMKRVVDADSFYRLKAAGLVSGSSEDAARSRCGLYHRFFSTRL